MVELEIKWCINIGLKLLVNAQRKGPSTELLENPDFKSPRHHNLPILYMV